jgi:hypothetical protein
MGVAIEPTDQQMREFLLKLESEPIDKKTEDIKETVR